MSIQPRAGTKLLHYEIVSELGAGGMGIVYRARDTKLQRDVAIKFLHNEPALDEQNLARFRREARVLASLNHPNIAAIYDLQEVDEISFLVLELVEGETLAGRIKKKPLQPRQAFDVCYQIAEALEAAHDKGIVHRDLKPANVKLTPDGKVKVLDFGLAKAIPVTDSEDAATLTAAETYAGVLVGTVPYMSPEQARMEPIDRSSDIWAFGCVLYEALSGRRAFVGDSVTSVLASVLMSEPDWNRLPEGLDPAVQCLLKRCLQKDKRCRLQDIGDARIELEEALGIRAPTRPFVTRPKPKLIPNIVLALSVLVALGSLALLGWQLSGRSADLPESVTRFSIDLPSEQRIVASFNPSLEISPDGRTLYYMVPSKISGFTDYVRRLDELEAKTFPSISGGVPVFSPDSNWICFADTRQQLIKRARLDGSSALTIAPFDWIYRGDWSEDGYLYWTPGARAGIVRTPITGGEPEIVTKLDTSKNEQSHRFSQLLPGGNEILFTVAETTIESFDEAKIAVQSLKTGKRKILIEGGTSPRYSSTGHLLYARAGNLYAVSFDAKRLEVSGSPVPVVEGLLMSVNTGAAYYSLSETGTLAYVPGAAEGGERQLVWVERQGKETPLPLPPRSYLYPRLSPDGTKLSVEVEGPSHDFYVYDFERGVLTKMTHDGLSHAPVWSPDGKQIGFRSWKLGGMSIWSMPADGSSEPNQLLSKKGMQSVVSWSPDGKYIAYTDMFPQTRVDVLVLPTRGERIPIPLVKTEFVEGSPKFSPDGKWLAYCSNESGKSEVYVRPFPGAGPKIQISSEGGNDPMWQRLGKEIYYRNGDLMMVVEVRSLAPFTVGAPRMLWKGHYSHGMSSSCGQPGVTSFNYDVLPDGSRFLMVKDVDQDVASNRIVVVLNWARELSRRMKQRAAIRRRISSFENDRLALILPE